tara:strand:- start:48 stop:542 length:495 start_codon:yes stop_codon:yes gene_type:complete
MNLFQLTEQQNELLRMVENAEMSLEDVSDTLEGVDYEIDKKVENICYVLRLLESRETAMKNEIDRITELKQGVSGNIERLKKYALQGMNAAGKKRIESDLFTVSIRQGREVVKVNSESVIPFSYTTTSEPVTKPNKKLILAALKSGEKVAGCEMIRAENSLSIK